MSPYKTIKSYLSPSEGRAGFLVGFILVLMIILGGRLLQKSVIEHSHYSEVAQAQYLVRQEINPERGKIYARAKLKSEGSFEDYYPLATNKELYVLWAIPKNIKDKNDAALKISTIIDVPAKDIFANINNDKLYVPPIKHRLTKEQADQINRLNLGGIMIVPEAVRYYPEDGLASHVLGFVNAEAQGQYGAEGFYDEILKGFKGVVLGEKDTKGRIIETEGEDQPLDGADLVLTIDHNIQFMAQRSIEEAVKKFEATSGEVVIIDPKTGAILAMASTPSFNPNEFNKVAKDNLEIFVNPVIARAYEPGSIFKPFIMSAAIDAGKVEPDTQETFSNYVVVQGYEIHTALDKAYGRETMTQCLENSDNVCLVWVGNQVGDDILYDYITKFGFGRTSEVDLFGEAKGKVLEGKKWRDINRATISFGQGISVTPLQIANAFAAIANDGKLMKPYIVDKIIKPDGSAQTTSSKEIGQIIKKETADKIDQMLTSVVERGFGKKAQVAGYKVAGKTGTAQVPNPAGGYFEDRVIHSFAGYAPADDPAFAMVVVINEPKNVNFSEASATPTFGEIASWLLNYLQVAPQK